MPRVVETPKHLRPYMFHGLALRPGSTPGQATGDCPWCGREDKLSVSAETGQWRCWVCAEGNEKGGGNALTFIRLLWERSDAATTDLAPLAEEIGLLYPDSLMRWGVCRSIITNEWLIPAHGADGKLSQLYRYGRDVTGARMMAWPTPELHHQIHGVSLFDRAKPEVHICEGWKDGIAWWEGLKVAKETGNSVNGHPECKFTASEASSLLSRINVLAIPSCGAVGSPFERWLPLLAGKRVTMLFDSDHPRRNGDRVSIAGRDAMQRAAAIMANATEPPSEIRWVRWGDAGWDPERKSGWDVRDHILQGDGEVGRAEMVGEVLGKLAPIPEDWVPGRTAEAAARGGTEIECIECHSWEEFVNHWRKAMKWTEGLDYAASVCLASIISTMSRGSQLWIKLISPPSTGKSVLCEAFATNPRHVIAKSTLRGFHSGYRESRDSDEDNSLIVRVSNKTLVIKDADTLLKAPNKEQILSEARDIYDRVSRADYRNKKVKDYKNINMTIILAGTEALTALDESELGARFLDCYIMHEIDEEMEDEVNWRVFNRAKRNMAAQINCSAETHEDADMLVAKRVTGGFIDHLCQNAERMLDNVEMSDATGRKCMALAKFVSYFRARERRGKEEREKTGGREASPRLTEQHVRLALSLAAVLGKTSVDEDVMRRVTRVALDTARGKTLDIGRALYQAGHDEGLSLGALALRTHDTDNPCATLVKFLRKLGAVELFEKKVGAKSIHRRYRLTRKMAALWSEVVGEGG